MTETAHANLVEALHAFQAEGIQLTKDAKATVPTKTGGSFTYRYLTLDTLMDKVLPVLNKHGLAWITMPCATGLRYRLWHAQSGEQLEDVMPLGVSSSATPQQVGSAISYCRRYSMLAVLGLVADEDDDGHAGGARDELPPARAELNGDQPRVLTSEERVKVIDAISEAGMKIPAVLAEVGVGSHSDLNVEHARKIREILDDPFRAEATA